MVAKVVTLAEAAAMVEDGDVVALSGNMMMAPMSFVRQLVRSGTKNLRLIAVPTGGLALDLLIGSETAASVEFAQIALGEYGMAPSFRRMAEAGRIQTLDHT
jgi:glutaconate CoA-transferase, subunit A